MNKRNVESSLQIKARRYLEYVNRQEKRAYQKGEIILSSLSNSLRAEILKSIYGKNFKKEIPFFSSNFSEDFIDALMLRVKEVSYAPEELIYHQNETEEHSIYFIIRGKVEIYQDMRNKQLQLTRLTQGKSFGEKEFILGTPHEFSVRSLECTRLIYVKRKDFIEVLQNFPEDKEKFLMIKDKMALGNSFIETCFFCESKNHSISFCPFIGYHPKKIGVVGNWLQNVLQRRNNKYHRRRIQKTCSLIKKKEISNIAYTFYAGHKNDSLKEIMEEKTMISEEEINLKDIELNYNFSEGDSRVSRGIEIDKGKNFKCYFPWDNIDEFINKLRNRNLPIKKMQNRSNSPKKTGTTGNSLYDLNRKSISFTKASQMIHKGCHWFKRQWPFKKN